MGVKYTDRMPVDQTAHVFKRFDFANFLHEKFKKIKTVPCRNKDGAYHLLNVPAAFDIETSTFPIAWDKFGIEFAWNACLVCWQFGLDGTAWIGRTWEEWDEAQALIVEVLGLSDKYRLRIYDQNLPYEWSFMRKRYAGRFTSCFARDKISVLRATTVDGLEFADSLALSNNTLENMAKDLVTYKGIKKTSGWDYSKIRHHSTPLTDEEVEYAINDVLVLMCYIKEKMDAEGGDISAIPMTSTGYVRRDCRLHTIGSKDKGVRIAYRKLMKKLRIDSCDEEFLRLWVFAGGYTHANPFFIHCICHDVASFDVASMYPAMAVCKYMPMEKIGDELPGSYAEALQWMSEYCCVFECILYDVEALTGVRAHSLSESKSKIKYNVKNKDTGKIEHPADIDNGRIVNCDVAIVSFTELDFATYLETYKHGSIEFTKFIRYRRGFLPPELVERFMWYYCQKTLLKGDADKLSLYYLTKAMCNSIYGMMCQHIIMEVHKLLDGEILDEYEYITKTATAENSVDVDVLKSVNRAEAFSKYNMESGFRNNTRFTYYPWACYITAHARRTIFKAIHAAGNAWIYTDTDSIKLFKGKLNEFEVYLQEYHYLISEEMTDAMKRAGLPEDLWIAPDKDGGLHPLGFFEREADIEAFKTLGAKRYLSYQYDKDEQKMMYKPTVAGCSKDKLQKYLNSLPDPFAEFEINKIVPPEYSGRMIAGYINEETSGIVTDYLGNQASYHEYSSCTLRPATFEMTISEDFDNYLDQIFCGYPLDFVM